MIGARVVSAWLRLSFVALYGLEFSRYLSTTDWFVLKCCFLSLVSAMSSGSSTVVLSLVLGLSLLAPEVVDRFPMALWGLV